jgi:hypothetical protein
MASLSSCTIFRKGSRKSGSSDSSAVVNPVDQARIDSANNSKNLDEARRAYVASFAPVLNKQLQFTTFSGKAKMHYEGKGQKQEFTSHIRIIKDKVIWVSVTALGGIVQVARIYVTPDTFKLLNYLEMEVTIMPLAEAKKVLPAPVDFSILQNLIVGNVLRTGGTLTDATDLGGVLSLQVEEPDVVEQITYSKADTTIKSLQLRSTGANLMTGLIQFMNYEMVSNRKFAMNRDVLVINDGDQYKLDMNFNNPVFDLPVDVPFSIPKNYKVK